MSYLLECPSCGHRAFGEFLHGGEIRARPLADASTSEWVHFVYDRTNRAGPHKEWWYHIYGCRRWFIATRDTRSNLSAAPAAELGPNDVA